MGAVPEQWGLILPPCHWCTWTRHALAFKVSHAALVQRQHRVAQKQALSCRYVWVSHLPCSPERKRQRSDRIISVNNECRPSTLHRGAHPPSTAQRSTTSRTPGSNEMMAAQLRSSRQWGQPAVIGRRCLCASCRRERRWTRLTLPERFFCSGRVASGTRSQNRTCFISQQV